MEHRLFPQRRRFRRSSSSFFVFSLWSIQMVASWLTPPLWTVQVRHNSRSNSRLLCTRTTDELPMIDLKPYKQDFPRITPFQWKLLEALSLKLYNWNAKVNLISRKDIDSLVPNHVGTCSFMIQSYYLLLILLHSSPLLSSMKLTIQSTLLGYLSSSHVSTRRDNH